MNQNLLIVDDESEILSWLAELFKYEFDQELGVYTAGSAMDAIKLLSRVRFDVVLTDIRMPGMDGITLFHHIKENWPRCKTVFLTGYRNFEDMYQVINHEDVKYILKSEDDDVIMGAVRDFLLMSRRELEQEKQSREQEGWLAEAKYWLKREYMDRLCAGNLDDNLVEWMRMLGIPLEVEKDTLLFLLRIEKEWEEGQVQERFFLEEALNRILQENVPLKLNFYMHILGNHQELLLVQPKEEAVDWQMVMVISQGAVEYVQEQFRLLHNATVSAVMDAEPVGLAGVSASLRKLKQYMFGYIGGAREVILKMESFPSRMEEKGFVDYASQVASLKNLLEMRKKKDYFSLLRNRPHPV